MHLENAAADTPGGASGIGTQTAAGAASEQNRGGWGAALRRRATMEFQEERWGQEGDCRETRRLLGQEHSGRDRTVPSPPVRPSLQHRLTPPAALLGALPGRPPLPCPRRSPCRGLA